MSEKADFTDEYNAADPRPYYAELGALAYQVPEHGSTVFRQLAEALPEGDSPPTVLDVCCSYGINAALMNHDLSFDDLRRHYTSPQVAPMSRSDLLAEDRAMLQAHRREDALRVVGLDVSGAAVGYAVDAGLLDAGVVTDLESEAATPAEADLLGQADLVTITGGVGYVNERTFEQIATAGDGAAPWVAALTLRWIDFDPIAEALGHHGLVTERLEGFAVRQRRFADGDERDHVLTSLEDQGLSPTAMEEEGWHCAELFVARPEDAVNDQSIDELLGDGLTSVAS